MQHAHEHADGCCCCRRDFLQTVGAAAGTLTLLANRGLADAAPEAAAAPVKRTPTVRGAFVYPPTAVLQKEGYWSWPGSSFNPEAQQREYTQQIAKLAGDLKMQVDLDSTPLDSEASAAQFIAAVKQSKPDAVLLVLFKKLHWNRVLQVLDTVQVPTIVVAPIGVLLAGFVQQVRGRLGAYLINSIDIFEPLREALGVIAAARRLRDSLLVDIRGEKVQEAVEKHLGTRVRRIPHARFVETYNQVALDGPVKQLAAAYTKAAQEIVEPTTNDIAEAARASFALKRIVEAEKADALMMDCLPGLRKPHKHVPPCMGFMSLHDQGIVAGCQSDLEATLTMMLVQQLFGRPAFQNNPCLDTERNHYFGAHCTAPSKMSGPDAAAEPYILRSHNEAGWGCVPQVLFPEGQKLTMVHYFTGEAPKMSIYTGAVVRCYPKLAGGCRTNVEMTVNEVSDIHDLVYGGHQMIFYGDGQKRLRTFCQLFGIEAVS